MISYNPKWLDEYQWFAAETDQGWYWHLYWKDVRINGGLIDYGGRSAAEYEAERIARNHHWRDTLGTSGPV